MLTVGYTAMNNYRKILLSDAELTLSQFVQSMGYSEQDVISAKTELQKRGTEFSLVDFNISFLLKFYTYTFVHNELKFSYRK